MTVTRKWTLLAAVLVVAIVAAGWFLLVSPKRSEAAALRADAASREDANARLEQQIQVLQAQQLELPKQRAELATMRKQIPDNPALPSLVRDLTKAGRDTGATIDSLAPSVPEAALDPQAVTAPVTTGTESSASDTTGSTDTSETPATTTTPVPPPVTLYRVPLTVQVSGSYFELEQFVNRLEGLRRSFLVTGFTIGEVEGAEAVAGDLTLELKGRVFLSPPASATQDTTATTPTATGTTQAGQ